MSQVTVGDVVAAMSGASNVIRAEGCFGADGDQWDGQPEAPDSVDPATLVSLMRREPEASLVRSVRRGVCGMARSEQGNRQWTIEALKVAALAFAHGALARSDCEGVKVLLQACQRELTCGSMTMSEDRLAAIEGFAGVAKATSEAQVLSRMQADLEEAFACEAERDVGSNTFVSAVTGALHRTALGHMVNDGREVVQVRTAAAQVVHLVSTERKRRTMGRGHKVPPAVALVR